MAYIPASSQTQVSFAVDAVESGVNAGSIAAGPVEPLFREDTIIYTASGIQRRGRVDAPKPQAIWNWWNGLVTFDGEPESAYTAIRPPPWKTNNPLDYQKTIFEPSPLADAVIAAPRVPTGGARLR